MTGGRKITSADTKTIPSFVLPEDRARNEDLRQLVAAVYGAKPSALTDSLGDPVMKRAKVFNRAGLVGTPTSSIGSQDGISTYDPSWGERIGDAAGRLAMRLGADRHGYQNASRKVRDIVDFVPGVGDAVMGDEVIRSARRGDYVDAAIGTVALAAGLAPLAGDMISKALRFSRNPARAAVPEMKILADKTLSIYDPPVKKPRDFALDYPKGAGADVTGRLRYTIEGEPLGQGQVAGRQKIGAADKPIGHEGILSLGTRLTREGVSRVPTEALGGGSGITEIEKYSRAPYAIKISDSLSKKEEKRVLGHEVGHVIHTVAGEFPVDGLGDELGHIFSTLATGRENASVLTTPRNFGYPEDEWADEYMAEAIRAYMTNPNYMKTVAPKTAARIRQHVNSHPKLKDVIQFNSLAGPALGAGLLGYGALETDQAEAKPMWRGLVPEKAGQALSENDIGDSDAPSDPT
ncbi:hypothetical protein Swit_4453 [Rhizorhabdus wittichii RW1]|uniref:Uncharacterized protein n=1 Tax=Rhizorhabdus wittichii (strain DSM 6014 / CCUG 31198 / JCM 15750 / NBRC 105917 / EY 4224 / RW1) TaxID=392499 RepID=A0A9J9LGQ4_RHIWR|nr:hypothetical protein Swit_4453 [Rhizorhabdus wittichii RW1]